MSSNRRYLYLHIGLPKTATTWLQEIFFPRLENVFYIGLPRSRLFNHIEDRPNGYRTMACALNRAPEIWTEFGNEIFAEMMSAAPSNKEMTKHVLISDEGIGRIGSRPQLLRSHLLAIASKSKDWGFDRLRVACAIRRQDSWYASHYAQISHKNPSACQTDFEDHIADLLDPFVGRFRLGMLLDFNILFDHIAEAVGQDNLLMLPYEMLVSEPEAFIQSFESFIGSAAKDPELANHLGKRNVRSLGLNRWEIEPPASDRTVKVAFARFSFPAKPKPKPSHIEVTPEISEKILSAYETENRTLSEKIAIELAQYQYFAGSGDGWPAETGAGSSGRTSAPLIPP